MIMPHPESDIHQNPMVLGAELIVELKKSGGSVLTEILLENFLARDYKRTPDMFVEVVVFLYSVNLVKDDNFKLALLSVN